MRRADSVHEGARRRVTPEDAKVLRHVFDEEPELYDRARPGYPSQVFSELAELVGLKRGSRVLELGCGTGQATLPLAERGYRIVALDLGEHVAALASRKLAAFPSVEVVAAAFEEWALPDEPFDAVVAATSFHWIDPARRVAKAADALRPGGALAVISTHHIAGGDAQFFEDVQRCYERWMPGTRAGSGLPSAAEIPSDSEELNRSDRFAPAVLRRHEWELTYSTSEYLDLLQSYSGHRALEPRGRTRLLACIAELITRTYGGEVTKRYLTELRVARLARE
jgi:SAM-dependent methyltransferase